MNLAERLQRPCAIGYGRRYVFAYRGNEYFDKGALIQIVAERYSTRFGAVNYPLANLIYEALAKKYCCGVGWRLCFRAIELQQNNIRNFEMFAHPKSARDESGIRWAQIKAAEDSLNSAQRDVFIATNNAEGDYADIVEIENTHTCFFCGGRYEYSLYVKALGRLEQVRASQPYGRTYLPVCRSPVCKALVDTFPAVSRSRTLLPLAKIIMEITKNGDRSEKCIEIKKRTDEHTKSASTGRHRQKRSEINRSVSH